MSTRGHNSRRPGPSFLFRRGRQPSHADLRLCIAVQTVLVRRASIRYSLRRHDDGTPGMPAAIRIMKGSSPRFLPCLSGHTLRANSGALRHVAALLSGLLSQSKSGPLLQNARLGTWEPGLSLRLRQWMTRSIREFNSRRFTMYQNRISLIGFLGQNATTHTANNASFTVLSLATKSSYKDKKTGEYKGQTEWHRCIVWGKLADYAKTLTKGAHLAVEGELRSRERVDKKSTAKVRVWEVRVSSILKLDRAERSEPAEHDNDAEIPEEEAA
jgi:single-strand DNA-binding protein